MPIVGKSRAFDLVRDLVLSSVRVGAGEVVSCPCLA